MPTFLHVADVHLGFDRYDCKARTLDFFYAFQDALEKYAIADPVDFVLIAGDLFEHRMIQPAVLNQAQICLQMLQDANIPVLAIEGNHDNCPYGTQTSWLRYLADHELLILLEPDVSEPETFRYCPWDGRRGGYIDLDCGVRVFGSNWYGASAPRAIAQIAEAIQQLPAPADHSVLMFHHGLEGQIARYSGALRYSDLLPLQQAGIDYLALGHIHKNYTVENWIFNPGSVEANSIEESRYDRGVYRVEITPQTLQVELKRDYYQRAIVRLKLVARGQERAEDIYQSAIAQVQAAIQSGKLNPEDAPLVEFRIEGQVGFDRQELNTRQLQHQLQQLSRALILLLRYEAEDVTYVSPLSEQATRLEIEREVFTDLVSAHATYKKQAQTLAQGLIQLKELQLENHPEEELYAFISTLLNDR
jgi:DNA repair exonuclease SbcCD nuclease subunit